MPMDLMDLLTLVQDGRGRYDGEEIVDDLAHARQTAGLALADGAPDDLVTAALLHDIGHHPAVVERYGQRPHAEMGAELLGPLLGRRAEFVVRQHVAAKRHLTATDATYAAGLSEASRISLERQGGPAVLPEMLVGWGPLALQLRRWDDAAKVVGGAEPAWDLLVETAHRAAASAAERNIVGLDAQSDADNQQLCSLR